MTTNQTTYIQEIQSLISGMQKHSPNLALIIASTTYTSVQLVQLMQALATSTAATLAAKSAWHDAVQAHLKLVAADGPVVRELRQTVGLMYSNSESVLADFGLSPKKVPAPLSTAARAARAAKAKATRVARGTTSKKQKAMVTGNVTGVSITPITAPVPAPAVTPGTVGASPSPSPSPSPSTSTSTSTSTTPTTTPSPAGPVAAAGTPHA